MDEEIRAFPAKVITREQGNAPIPDAYSFSAEISSTRVDAYFTHMTEGTLYNFVEDAKAGVSFLDSHNSRALGYGRSYDAKIELGDVSRVLVDFYTIPGVRVNNQSYQSTDDFIRAIQGGLVNDVSVGFYGGRQVCDICGTEAMSFWGMLFPDCDHWPGEKYVIEENGKDELATYSIDGARLAEASAVYKGATPQAQILTRANEAVKSGQLDHKMIEKIKKYYHIGDRIGVKRMDNELEKRLMDLLAKVEGETIEDKVRLLLSEREGLEVRALKGDTLFDELIESALAEGVRAMGQLFALDAYRDVLSKMSIEKIKELRQSWQAQADETLTKGRQTKEEDKTKKPVRVKPAYTYRS
jgi:hypothetical protein